MPRKMRRVRWQKRRLLRSPPPAWSSILRAVFVFLLVVPGNAAEQKNAEAQKPSVPPPPAVIPVAEIATQATQVGNLIRGFATNIAAGSEIETIRKFLPQVSADVGLELKSTANILKETP